MNKYDQALEAAARIRFPAARLPSRVGHHWVDVARAYQWTNQPRQSLRGAPSRPPHHLRTDPLHPSVRETLAALLRAERRRTHSLVALRTPFVRRRRDHDAAQALERLDHALASR